MKKILLTGLLVLLTAFAFAQEAGWEKPQFDGESSAAVDLIYIFKADDVQETTLFSDTVTTVTVMGTTQRIPVSVNMVTKRTVKTVNSDGSARVEIMFTRVYGSFGTGFSTMEFDSDKPETMTMPGISDYNLLVGTPFTATVTAKGEIVDSDSSAVKEKLNSSEAATMNLGSSVDDALNQAFITLPAGKVKTGDVYGGKNIVKEMPGLGELRSEIKYEVLAVSADKKSVLIKPITKIGMDSIQVNRYDSDGWILFSIRDGDIVKSLVTVHMEATVTIPDAGATFDMVLDTIAKLSVN